MKITLCGSIAFYDKMLSVKGELEKDGHIVKLPPHEIEDENGKLIPIKQYYEVRKATQTTEGWIWDNKLKAMKLHFDKVAWADAILVLNYDKNNIKGYLGGNTLMEMGLALHLEKSIYMLNSIPEVPYKEEILGMKPILINGNLKKIN